MEITLYVKDDHGVANHTFNRGNVKINVKYKPIFTNQKTEFEF